MNNWDTGPVLLRKLGAVAVVTLNKPERKNAWSRDLEARYFDALRLTADDAEVRAIVITGAGSTFCVGADMEDLASTSEAGSATPPGTRHIVPLGHPKPIIAAVNGACAGIGLVHALMCDLRFSASSAKFSTAFARRGLIAEHGMSWVLPRVVGRGNASDLLLSGRVITAGEAVAMGLVNRVYDPESLVEHAVSYATELAAMASPRSMAGIKRQLWRHSEMTLLESLAESNEMMAESLRAPDFREGVQSFLDKRLPQFEPYRPTEGSQRFPDVVGLS